MHRHHSVPDCDGSVLWNSCGTDGRLPEGIAPILSRKDAADRPSDTFTSPFEYGKY